MNPTLAELIELADSMPVAPYPDAIAFEIYGPQDVTPMREGYYRPGVTRDRTAFAQAVGKLIAAGYEVVTVRAEDR